MKIILDKYDEQEIAHVAQSEGLDADALREMFLDIMESNFYDDLWTIANENREELSLGKE